MRASPGRLVWLAVTAVGWLGWAFCLARLLARGTHILQLEGYQTARFLRWWLGRPQRLIRGASTAVFAGGVGLSLAMSCPGGPGPFLASVGWAALGVWRATVGGTPPAKKPLVWTMRARRLAAGQALLASGLLILTARTLARGRPGGYPTLPRATAPALALAALVSPLVVAGANLLLYPVEATIRRYYLRDATARLRRFEPDVVAVAGSYGKTSTKEFIAVILGAHFSVLKPPASYNTPLGLARVIREQLAVSHEVFVAELGDWVPGDIAALCGMLRPRIGVLTTIGPEHLERFQTMERVVASKFELLEALPAGGTAIVNWDDPATRQLGERSPLASVITYGLSEGAQIRGRDVRTSRDGLEFVVDAVGHERQMFNVSLLGRHNVLNVLAATAVGLAMGMSLKQIALAARRIQPVEHRLQPLRGEGGVLVIDDAFNSNPTGAAAALDVLAELEASQRILVTPGMVELAEREFEANRVFARQAADVCDAVILVGRERAAPLIAGLRDRAFPPERTHVVRDLNEATARLATLVRAGDVVLFENDLPDTYADAS